MSKLAIFACTIAVDVCLTSIGGFAEGSTLSDALTSGILTSSAVVGCLSVLFGPVVAGFAEIDGRTAEVFFVLWFTAALVVQMTMIFLAATPSALRGPTFVALALVGGNVLVPAMLWVAGVDDRKTARDTERAKRIAEAEEELGL